MHSHRSSVNITFLSVCFVSFAMNWIIAVTHARRLEYMFSWTACLPVSGELLATGTFDLFLGFQNDYS